MKKGSNPLFYIKLNDWVWWAWAITTALLIAGLAGYDVAFIWAMAVTAGQGFILLLRDRKLADIAIQNRAAYLLMLVACYVSPMWWLFWLPVLGTVALNVFGYCTMTRMLSLLPWNSHETLTLERWRRTFFSAPDLDRVPINTAAPGCAGGICTLEAQVAPPKRRTFGPDCLIIG